MFQVSPNPTCNQLNIILYSQENTKVDINIYNVLGQTIHIAQGVEVINGTNELMMDISLLCTGYYMLEVMTESGLYRAQKKLVKN